MRYAIFSDVQGNYEALKRFFEINENMPNSYLCLGDIVQYGTSFNDNRCIDLVQKKNCIAVRGNHEDYVLAHYEESKKKIYPHNLEYLASLPSEREIDGEYRLIHAPSGKRIQNVREAAEEFTRLPAHVEVCFFGHSHRPTIFSRDKKGVVKEEKLGEELQLSEDLAYMINPGGIGLYWGLPQTYMVFESRTRKLQFERMNNAN